ncbi:hypothetical protein AKJ16_DCAP20407 [Drosera capensis]
MSYSYNFSISLCSGEEIGLAPFWWLETAINSMFCENGGHTNLTTCGLVLFQSEASSSVISSGDGSSIESSFEFSSLSLNKRCIS